MSEVRERNVDDKKIFSHIASCERYAQGAKSCRGAFIIIYRSVPAFQLNLSRGLRNTLNFTNPHRYPPDRSEGKQIFHLISTSRARDVTCGIIKNLFLSFSVCSLNTCVVDNNADGLPVNDEISFLSFPRLSTRCTPHEAA